MSRPARLMIAVGFTAALVAVGRSSIAAETALARKPNVILIVADDLGYADLGFQGCKDIPTPHLDALAAGGVRFTAGYVSGPYCSPTRAGLMTGRYQTRFGHEFNPGPGTGDAAQRDNLGLPIGETTVANLLKSAGYATGMVGKWHLGYSPKHHPRQRGFDEFYGFFGGAHSYVDLKKGSLIASILRNEEPIDESEYLTDAFAREAVAYVERHQREPFFLYWTFNAVHTPMHAADKYLARFPNITDPHRKNYAAMLSAMDDAVGRLTAKLRELSIEENTLLFFISDNGGPLAVNGSSNVPLNGKKATVWEGGVRVPFVMSWKGRLPAGAIRSEPVISLDIPTTAVALAGGKLPSDRAIDGVNLMTFAAGEAKQPAHEYLYWRFGGQRAIRDSRYKLLHLGDQAGWQLYDLQSDIGEQKNLAADKPDEAVRLLAAWESWNKQQAQPLWGQPNRVVGAAKAAKAKGGNKSKAKTKVKAGT